MFSPPLSGVLKSAFMADPSFRSAIIAKNFTGEKSPTLVFFQTIGQQRSNAPVQGRKMLVLVGHRVIQTWVTKRIQKLVNKKHDKKKRQVAFRTL